MKKAASDYDLKNLRSVRVFLYHLPELADAVADKFPVEQNFDAEHNCSAEDTEESILAAISETSIRNDIQNVVAEYGCAVDSVVLGSAVTVVDRKHDKRKIWNADVVFTICPRVP